MADWSFPLLGVMTTMTSERAPALYDVWRISFEYEDQSGIFKERPVIIGAINEENASVLAVKVTSHAVRPGYPGEVPLEDWKEAGLGKPSIARCSKTLIVPRFYFSECQKYGRLSLRDSAKIAEALRSLGKTC